MVGGRAGSGRSPLELSRQARAVSRALTRAYPEARCDLVYRSPWELLVATVLSAQSTDAQVNRITPALFAALPTARAMAVAARRRLEDLVRSAGMFRRKAEVLQRLAERVEADHGGEVPRTLDALTRLPGVGRKTANVVLGNAFGRPAITVDTHVGRLARRIGLTRQQDPDRVEQELTALLPPSAWTPFSHRMIAHGRRVCLARRPRCASCALASLCCRVGVDCSPPGRAPPDRPLCS